MSDLSQTAANVRAGSHATKRQGTAGAAIVAGNVLYLDSDANTLKLADANSGTNQVETATVAGTIGVSGVGNATVVITAAGMANSPKTISVAVANNDTASLVAGKIRTALNADTDVTDFFTVGGSSALVSLTSLTKAANDATMNISVDNGTCSGLTPALTSADTTPGVAPVADALVVAGIALNSAASGQPVSYVTLDAELNIGATLVAGASYMLSETPGGIAPVSDAASGDSVTVLGVANSTSTMNFNPTAGGVVA